MKPSRFTTFYLLSTITLVLGGVLATAWAQEPTGRTPFAPPRPSYAEATTPADVAQPRIQSLPPLKAVLIVGPIDGDTDPWTLDEIENMEDAAGELEANGVEVHRFYTPHNDWEQIKQAADSAHFLFYRGHGVYWSDFPSPTVGGFALKNRFVSSDDIRQDLHLAPNAIVMLYGCFTAGHSSHPADHQDIGIDEAKRRVAQYSDPFFDAGAAGYYANWFGSAFQMLVRYLFQGETLGDAYESYFDFDPSTVHRTTYPDHSQTAMWLDKDYWTGYWQYNNAFTGQPDETLESLFASPALGNLPESLQFVYSMPEQRLLYDDYQATPLNVGNDEPLTWTIATSGTWFTVAPTGGTTPSSFWITPTTFVTSTVYTHTGAVTVTVTGPVETGDSPHPIGLTLRIVDEPFFHYIFPMFMNDYTPPPPAARYPNDPFYDTHQWGLKKVNAPDAWGRTTGQGILIAVLDSGTDLDHPDLASKLRTDIDWDFVNNHSVADDDYGHGTHVSGIAAAATDNGVGVAGMGWDAQILSLKVLDDEGNGWGDDIANAIYYAADNGAHVINLSLGTRVAVPCPQYMQDAVDYAYDRDVVVVAAAGNEYTHMEIFPANCEHVLGVAATDQSDNRASYSNYGDHVSIAAPGSGIYSTGWTGDGETNCTSGYCYKSGTSMATPHVAGLAALVRALYPSYTPDQVASAILDNAMDKGTPGWDQEYGCGRIDAFEALSKGAQDSYPVCLQGMTIWSNDVQREPTSAPFAPDEIIVSFRPGIQAEQAAQQYGDGTELLPALGAWRLRVPAGQERAALAELRADPAVVYAELNYLVFAQ